MKLMYIIFSILPVLIFYLISVKRRGIKHLITGWKDLIGILIIFIIPAFIPIAWDYHPIAGIIYGVPTYTLIFIILLIDLEKSVPVWATRSLGITTLFIIIVIVPMALLPKIQNEFIQRSEVKVENDGIDIEFIESSLGAIRDSLNLSAEKIKNEQNKIDLSAKQLLVELNKRNKELMKLIEQQRELKLQVEQYKALASLTKKQAEAVQIALEKNKYLDYIVGLLIGIVSSGLVAFRTRFFGKKTNNV
jgi:hypothetical protein